MSHHPPGIQIDDISVTGAGEEDFGGWHEVTFRYGIANTRSTPAKITLLPNARRLSSVC